MQDARITADPRYYPKAEGALTEASAAAEWYAARARLVESEREAATAQARAAEAQARFRV